MPPVRTACPNSSARRISLRTCVWCSILLHLLLFYIPFHESKVEAMSGCMSMVIVSGSGTPGQSAEPSKSPAGPAKPKAVAEQKNVHQEKRTVPDSKPEPVVQPQRKPAQVEHRQAVVPPKPKPVVRQQPVIPAKVDPAPVKKPKKAVKKTKVAHSKPKKKRTRRKKTKKRTRHVRQQAAAKTAKNAPVAVTKTAASSSKQGSQTARQTAGNPGQGKKAQAKTSGGGTPKGPIQARFGSLHGPKITRWMRPKYPRKARDMGQTGLVMLRITIDANGRPIRVEVAKRAGSGFDEAAVAAARKSAFAPATHKGRPVACIALLPVRFNLKGN